MNTAVTPRKKLGIALSGGGFRASLFHIGVLARLAELDQLKEVEVISTVSGGSVLGAYYYLKVKQLLDGKRTDFPQASQQAYIKIVQEIEADFLAAVQKNLRMRALWCPYKDAQMFLSDDYSRSDRMAELYNKYIYLPLWRQINGSSAHDHIPLRDIKIQPPKANAGFSLADYNERNEFKIPNLVINATTLNTGHAWHFTSSWVGEPDTRGDLEHTIDSNFRLIQLRFDGMDRENTNVPRKSLADPEKEKLRKAKLERLTLADAVTASACVPAIFTPLSIHDLYWSSSGSEIVVELVDGGVFDNQGIDALYVEKCTDIICSDAAGQLEDERAPSSKEFSVVARANDVLMDRIRDDGFDKLVQNEHGARLLAEHDPKHAGNKLEQELRREWNVEKFAFFHLRESFKSQSGYPAFPGPTDKATADTGYVYRLSNIRTDLDSFCDIEAYSLMYDGYCLSNEKLTASRICNNGTLPQPNPGPGQWQFLQITRMLNPEDPVRMIRLLKHLEVGKEMLFKVFRLLDPFAIAIACVLTATFAVLTWVFWDTRLFSIQIESLTVGAIATALIVWAFFALLKSLETTSRMGQVLDILRKIRRGQKLSVMFALLGVLLIIVSALVTVQLIVFDRLYLRSGKIR